MCGEYSIATSQKHHANFSLIYSPGRFLAITALKYVIARLTTKYELQVKETNPMTPGRWIWENVMPDEKAVLLIRRRSFKD